MKCLLRRLALIAALLSELPGRRVVRGDVLDIILRSNGSMHSGNSVKGLSIDLISGSAASLEAVSSVDVSTFTQFRLKWYKDGDVVNARLSMRQAFCEGKNAAVSCSLNLSISAVNGVKEGNYSVTLHQNALLIAEAYVIIAFGEAQAVSFTNFPTGEVNCASENSSVVLSYSAVGFPAPMYKLICWGWEYTSEPSITGKFVIPPEVCCAGAVCNAEAFNENVNMRSADVIVREQPVGPVCRQHVGCLSARLEVFVQSCTSAGAGNSSNGRAISIAADDSSSALEAVVYQSVFSFVQLRLEWLKDGLAVNTPLQFRRHFCEGSPRWGSWILCRLRLPLSAVNGNRSGNYTVMLRNYTALVSSAWVAVTVSGQGSQNCSSNIDSLASLSVSPRFPLSCGPYSYSQTPAIDNNDSVTMDMKDINVNAVVAETSIGGNVSLIVSTVALGTMVLAAILAYVLCKRAVAFRNQIIQKSLIASSKNKYRNDSVICNADLSPVAADAACHLDWACSSDVGSMGGLLLEQATSPLRRTGTLSEDAAVEVDGVVTSVMAKCALHNLGASLPRAFTWNHQSVDQQPPASDERIAVLDASDEGIAVLDASDEGIAVLDASTCAVESEHKPSITFIIHAENVQVGSNNTMFVQRGPCSSDADSSYGSTQDAHSSNSSSIAFHECRSARDSVDLPLPESHYSSLVEQQS